MTELLLLLVFMAVAFAFLSKEEDLREIPLIKKELEEIKQENQTLRAKNAALIAERDELRERVAYLDQRLKELLPEGLPPAPNNEPMAQIPESQLRSLRAQNGRWERSRVAPLHNYKRLSIDPGSLWGRLDLRGGCVG